MAHSVLILDDDADSNSLLTDIFEQADYIVTSLEDPIEAVEVFRNTDYDIVVTDHKMPEMTGSEFMKKVKEIRPEVPVIMVSGYLENDTIRDLISDGVGGVFLKPLNIFSLLERTAELIEESKKMKEQAAAGNEGVEKFDPDGLLAKRGFAFSSFPCKSEVSADFAERLHGLRNFKSSLSLIGTAGTHYRQICEDIRNFYDDEAERFVYLTPESFDEEQATSMLEVAKSEGAERVTCVLLNLERMDAEQKTLATKLPKGEGPFASFDLDIRTVFCVSGDLDTLFDEAVIDENLYILMGTAEVQVPSLKQCAADISVMAQQIVADVAREKGMVSVPQFEKSARDFFRSYEWPGNFGELSETVRRMMEEEPGDVLTLDALENAMKAGKPADPQGQAEALLGEARDLILKSVSGILGDDPEKVAAFFGTEAEAIKELSV